MTTRDGDTSSKDATMREARRAASSPREGFIGREDQRSELLAAFDQAMSGHGQLVLVAGEPGIGKTALASWLAETGRRRGADVRWGRCWEAGGAPPYWPWVNALRDAVHDVPAERLAAWAGPGATHLAAIVPELDPVASGVAASSDPINDENRFLLFDAMASVFKGLAVERPQVLVIDDLQEADKPSLLFLRFLVREITDARVMVAATYRDVEVSRRHPLSDALASLRRERNVIRLPLRGLPFEDVRAFLDAMRGEPVAEPFARMIADETGGNPFFIEEIVRHLVEEGVVRRERGRWVSRLRADEIRLPESVRDVIGHRLERLSDPCRRMLRVAAVLGRNFPLEVLERVAGLERENVLDGIGQSTSAGLIREVPRGVGRYEFVHALIRETLYEELRAVERMSHHRCAAETLLAFYANDPEPHLGALAHHYFQAAASGTVDQAVTFAVRAASHAKGQLAWEEAAEHLERALELVGRDETTEQVFDLLLETGETRWRCGEFDRARSVFLEAVQTARKLGSGPRLARAALGLSGTPGFQSGETDPELVATLEAAIEALGEAEGPLAARVLSRLAAALTFSDQRERRTALARRAVEVARRSGDDLAIADALIGFAMVFSGPDHVEERLAAAKEASERAERAGSNELTRQGHTWRLAGLLERGDVTAAREVFRSLEQRAREARDPYSRWVLAVHRTLFALIDGRFDEVEALAHEALELGQEGQNRNATNIFGTQILGALREKGRLGELVDLIRLSVEQYPELPALHCALASIYAELERLDEARSELEHVAVDDFAGLPRDLTWLVAMRSVAEAAVAVGDTARAATLYDMLLPYADRCAVLVAATCLGSISRHLGNLATTLERFDDAERHYRDAVEMNERIESRPWTAYTMFDHAGMLERRRAPGDPEEAVRLLSRANAIAASLGMTRLRERIDALRKRLTPA